jgi:hypothetical protein
MLRAERALTLKELARAPASRRASGPGGVGTGQHFVRKLAALASALETSAFGLARRTGGGAATAAGLGRGRRPPPARPGAPRACAAPGRPPSAASSPAASGFPSWSWTAAVEHAAGLSLAEIFALHGEDYYRRLEREALSGYWSRAGRWCWPPAAASSTPPRRTRCSAAARPRSGCGRIPRTIGTVWSSRETGGRWRTTRRPWRAAPAPGRARALYATADHTVDTPRLDADAAWRGPSSAWRPGEALGDGRAAGRTGRV